VDITTTNNTKDLFKVEIKMTIEEMAKSYKDFREECGFKDPVALNEIEVAYEEGAYKVLKEIEKVFTADYPSIFMAAQAMRNKINELKNE